MMTEPEREDVPVEEEGNEANTQLLELQDALINAMTASGLLGKIRAELRGAALGMLRGDDVLQHASVGEPFNLMRANPSTRLSLLIVQEFLHGKGLQQSSGVLEAEASTNLHSDSDVVVLQNKFGALPGEGSILERLVSMVLGMEGTPSPAAAHSSQPESNDEPVDAKPVADPVQAAPDGPADDSDSFALNPAIRDGLDRYEDSLSFDQESVAMDPVAYDNIETL